MRWLWFITLLVACGRTALSLPPGDDETSASGGAQAVGGGGALPSCPVGEDAALAEPLQCSAPPPCQSGCTLQHVWTLGFDGEGSVAQVDVAAAADRVYLAGRTSGDLALGELTLANGGSEPLLRSFVAGLTPNGAPVFGQWISGDLSPFATTTLTATASGMVVSVSKTGVGGAVTIDGGTLPLPVLASFDADGDVRWTQPLDGVRQIQSLAGRGLRVALSARTSLELSVDGVAVGNDNAEDFSAFATRSCDDGESQWSRAFNLQNNGSPGTSSTRVAMDARGSVAVAVVGDGQLTATNDVNGAATYASTLDRIVLFVHDPLGEPSWSRELPSPKAVVHGIGHGPSGELVVFGAFEGEIGLDLDVVLQEPRGLFMASYDRQGALDWWQGYPLAAPELPAPSDGDLVVDADGFITVAAIANGVDIGFGAIATGPDPELALFRFDACGQPLWGLPLGSGTRAPSLAHHDGRIYLGGRLEPSGSVTLGGPTLTAEQGRRLYLGAFDASP